MAYFLKKIIALFTGSPSENLPTSTETTANIKHKTDTIMSNEAKETTNLLPNISIFEYAEVSRDKGDEFSEDAHSIKSLDNQSYFISLCDGVTGGSLSRYASRAVADIMTKYDIADVRDLTTYKDELQGLYSRSIANNPTIQKRLLDTQNPHTANLKQMIETLPGATTLSSCHIQPSADGTHYNADVYIVGNGAFFVIREDGFETVMYSKECLSGKYYSGVKVGINSFEIGSSKDYKGDFMEVKKSVKLYPGDVAYFMTDGLAAGVLDILEDTKKYSGILDPDCRDVHKFFKLMDHEKIELMRTKLTKGHIIDDDDVTLIRLNIPESQTIAL